MFPPLSNVLSLIQCNRRVTYEDRKIIFWVVEGRLGPTWGYEMCGELGFLGVLKLKRVFWGGNEENTLEQLLYKKWLELIIREI